MASGPNKAAWERLNSENPSAAQWLNMEINSRNLIDMLNEGLIVPRELPSDQPLEEWQRAYTKFKTL
jgi:hypothetical protein